MDGGGTATQKAKTERIRQALEFECKALIGGIAYAEKMHVKDALIIIRIDHEYFQL